MTFSPGQLDPTMQELSLKDFLVWFCQKAPRTAEVLADEIRDIISMQSSQAETSQADAKAEAVGVDQESNRARISGKMTDEKPERTSTFASAKNKKKTHGPEKRGDLQVEQAVTSHPENLSVLSPSEVAQIDTTKISEELGTPGYPCITVKYIQEPRDDAYRGVFASWLENGGGHMTADPSQMLPDTEIQDMVEAPQMLSFDQHSEPFINQGKAKTPDTFCHGIRSVASSSPQTQDFRDDIFSSTRKSSSLTLLSLEETTGSSELARNQDTSPPEGPRDSYEDIEDRQGKAMDDPKPADRNESLHSSDLAASPAETGVQVEVSLSSEEREPVESREEGDPARLLDPPMSLSEKSQNETQVKLSTTQINQHPYESSGQDVSLGIAESAVSSAQVQPEIQVALKAQGDQRPDVESVSSTLTSKPAGAKQYRISDLITDAIRDMKLLHRQQELPDTTLAKVFAVLRPRLDDASADSQPTWISTQWCHILRHYESESRVKTMLYLASCMAAAGSYDAEVKAEVAHIGPMRGSGEKVAAALVLKRWLGKYSNDGIERPLDDGPALSSAMNQEKTALLNNLSRGRKLARLVRILKFGVLFGSKTWSWIKLSDKVFKPLCEQLAGDARAVRLFSVLDKQVALMIDKGRPDARLFLDGLESESIVAAEEIPSLQAYFATNSTGGQHVAQVLAPDPTSLASAPLNEVVDQMIQGFGEILKSNNLGEKECLFVAGTVDVNCDSLATLKTETWLDSWVIAAALALVDKPSSVRTSISIPLHVQDKRGKWISKTSPLAGWRSKIDDFRREEGGTQSRRYFCPLNFRPVDKSDENGGYSHFTLLEINEEARTIYHYDSLATAVLSGKARTTLVKMAVQREFKYLGFEYIEAPTPQQNDGSSCGVMVIRNFRLRAAGLSAGTWDGVVDADQERLTIVRAFQTAMKDGKLAPSPASRKRKLEKTDPDIAPRRASKRKAVTKSRRS